MLTNRSVRWGALTNRPALRSPLRTEALPPNENSGEQPDESELSVQEGSFDESQEPAHPVEEEHELDIDQRTLGEQRIIDASHPPSPKGPVRVNSYAQSLIMHYHDQVKDAKKNEKKLQELLRTRERDITQLRSLRSDTFEGPPT